MFLYSENAVGAIDEGILPHVVGGRIRREIRMIL